MSTDKQTTLTRPVMLTAPAVTLALPAAAHTDPAPLAVQECLRREAIFREHSNSSTLDSDQDPQYQHLEALYDEALRLAFGTVPTTLDGFAAQVKLTYWQRGCWVTGSRWDDISTWELERHWEDGREELFLRTVCAVAGEPYKEPGNA